MSVKHWNRPAFGPVVIALHPFVQVARHVFVIVTTQHPSSAHALPQQLAVSSINPGQSAFVTHDVDVHGFGVHELP